MSRERTCDKRTTTTRETCTSTTHAYLLTGKQNNVVIAHLHNKFITTTIYSRKKGVIVNACWCNLLPLCHALTTLPANLSNRKEKSHLLYEQISTPWRSAPPKRLLTYLSRRRGFQRCTSNSNTPERARTAKVPKAYRRKPFNTTWYQYRRFFVPSLDVGFGCANHFRH